MSADADAPAAQATDPAAAPRPRARVVPEGRVGVGLQLPVQAQSRVFVEPWERDASPAAVAAVAEAADRGGYAYVGVCDHTAIPRDRADKMGTTWWEPLTTLAWLAARTTNVRLLTHVYVLAQRHPLAAAKALATLDVLSGGRLVVGIGAGHVEPEFDLYGVDFAARGRVLDESIDALRAATSDRWPTFEGDHWHLDGDLAVDPQPVQRPLPIWVGGSSTPALRRAGQRGDGWIPQGTLPHDMPDQLATVRHHAEAAGIDPATLDLGAMALPIYVGEPDWDTGRWTTTGPADKHVEMVRSYADMGCSHVQVRFRSRTLGELVEQVEAFGDDVLPHVND